MKTISYTDLQLIPELSHFTMFDFMNPDNDEVVNEFLWTLGFDYERAGLIYRVCQHRNMAGKAIIGLQIAGEVRIDRQFMLSPWATAEDRLIACSRLDRSLGDDLARSMNVQVSYGDVFALEESELKEYWQDQEEIERIEDQLASLGVIMDNIRGDQKRRDGSQKRPRDYHEQEQYEKVRKKKAHRSTLKHREVV